MAADVLDIFLGDRKVGAITALGGDRSIFTFDDAYADDAVRPTLGLSFKDVMGDLIRDQRRTQTRLSPFFSNLLPECQFAPNVVPPFALKVSPPDAGVCSRPAA